MKKVTDLNYPKNYSVSKEGVTQSLIGTYLQCRVKFLLALNRYYIPSSSKVMHFGSMLHYCLEKYYKKEKYSLKEYADPGMNLEPLEVERQKLITVPILEVYKEIYKKDKFKNVEQTFEVDFNGYKLRGKVDAISAGGYLVDHKTKSRIDEDQLADKLSFDFQSLFYVVAMEEVLGVKLKGAIQNVIRNPAYKQKKDTPKEFQKRLKDEMYKNPEHFFKRFVIPFTEKEKADYKNELIYKLEEINNVIDGKLKTYKNETQCITGWGACSFLKVCSQNSLALCKRNKKLFKEL